MRLGSLVGSQGKKIFFVERWYIVSQLPFLSLLISFPPSPPSQFSPFSPLPSCFPPFLHIIFLLFPFPLHPFSPQVRSQALHHAQRRVKALQEQLQTLEDELEVPRQDLEEKKREEMQRRKKIENFKKEIQVSGVSPACTSQARMTS